MNKLFYALLVMLFVTTACQNNTEKQQDPEIDDVVVEEAVFLDLSNFEDKAESLIGKQIVMNGMIDHVCKHGGQKMFMVNENADARIKITTGENMAAFNTELVGETLKVVGVIDEHRIDEEYLREWEEELIAGVDDEDEHTEKGETLHMGEHGGEGNAEETEESPEMKQISEYRQKIAESGKEYISFFSVTCIDYEVVETTEEDGV